MPLLVRCIAVGDFDDVFLLLASSSSRFKPASSERVESTLIIMSSSSDISSSVTLDLFPDFGRFGRVSLEGLLALDAFFESVGASGMLASSLLLPSVFPKSEGEYKASFKEETLEGFWGDPAIGDRGCFCWDGAAGRISPLVSMSSSSSGVVFRSARSDSIPSALRRLRAMSAASWGSIVVYEMFNSFRN